MGHAAEDMDTKAFRVQIGEWGAQPDRGAGGAEGMASVCVCLSLAGRRHSVGVSACSGSLVSVLEAGVREARALKTVCYRHQVLAPCGAQCGI